MPKQPQNRLAIENWIIEHVRDGVRVLDIGCGDGHLLARLRESRNVNGVGIEIAQELVMKAIQRGLSVHHGDVEEGLDHYGDKFFDVVVMSLTVQELNHPRRVLQEAFRVGKRLIVAFPNFAHWRARCQLACCGRAPRTPNFPYAWYESPNRHFFSVLDWEEFCKGENWQIIERAFLARGKRIVLLPNLRAEVGVYLLEEV